MKFRDLTANSIGKDLLKLKPGEEARGVFRGDPVDFRQHWANNRSTICPGRDKCDICRAGGETAKTSFRFRMNFVINENGAYVAKIFEQGKGTYEALRQLHQDYNLEQNQMKIRRVGSGKETTYSILPVPNGTLTKEQEKAVAAIKLHALEVTSNDGAAAAESDDEDDLPF